MSLPAYRKYEREKLRKRARKWKILRFDENGNEENVNGKMNKKEKWISSPKKKANHE